MNRNKQLNGTGAYGTCKKWSPTKNFGSGSLAFWACCVPIIGIWHVGNSFAQFPAANEQHGVGLAVYSVPVQSVQSASSPFSNGMVYHEGAVTGANVVPASYVTSIVPTNTPIYSTVGASYVSSSSSPMVVRNWALDVANAQLNLDSSKFPDVGAARQRLEQAMTNLENFLSTSPQHQANWLRFLSWNDLRGEINKPKPDQALLTQIEKTFRQNYFGLELRHFTSVRDALKNYLLALRYGTDQATSIEILTNRLKKLSDQVQMPGFERDFASTREIGQTLAYLSQAHQSPTLVSAVRSNYSRANARVLVSADFVRQKFSRPVNEPNPVDEVILGTQLYGQSLMQGWVTPQLVDSSTRAAIKLNLNGQFSSQNIGYNRSVKLHTQGFGNIAASETIALTDDGLIQLNDTGVDASLTSQIDDIEARLRIVRRIASKQAAKQKPLADSIAEGRLENRVRDQFHNQLGQQLSEANSKLKTPELPVLNRLGLQRPSRSTWSSQQYLALLWKLQDNDQLAAPSSCPLVVDPSGITLQLHESVVTNVTDPILAGRILRSSEMGGLSQQMAAELGTKASVVNDDEPWAITMENYHPVEIQLDDSLITFRIRTTKLDKGDQQLNQPASIEASYRISITNGAIQLDRQGDVKIAFSGRQLSNLRAVSLRSFLKKRFDEVFKQQLLDEPIRVTDKFPNELRGLQLASIQIDDGWIQAHLR
ncbi:MAG: hypothetical protein ABL921_06860 [Pirellula sp.]